MNNTDFSNSMIRRQLHGIASAVEDLYGGG